MRPKSTSEIETMRQAGQMLTQVLKLLKKQLKPGVSAKDLANLAAAEIKKMGGQPSFLGYEGFPDVMCVSINHEIVHGLPLASKIIRDGDVVKLDFGVRYHGLIVDGAETIYVGTQPPADIKRLISATERALFAGIDAIEGEGTKLGDIGAAIQAVLETAELGVIRELVGHGVGDKVHEPPNIPNYGAKGSGPALKSGMTICIEPMASLGDWPIQSLKNGTVVMKDGSIGAHFEHTVAVTNDGAVILTRL